MPDAPELPTPHDDYQYSLALQACIYCWPLFEMQRMRSATSARKAPGQGFAGDSPESTQRWCNLFTHERELLTAGKSRVVMPNNDTLYTNAWLDLSDGPLVITLPDTGERYYVLGFLDYFTNPFAHVGTRTTGNGAGAVLVTGPGWTGEVPPQFQAAGRHVRAATDWVWIIGRILVDGPGDVASVNALQDHFRIRKLDDWRAGRDSPARRFDARYPPRAPFDAARFADMVNDALATCAPPEADRTLVAQFREVGIGAAPLPAMSAAARAAMERACRTTQALLEGGENALFDRSRDDGAPAHRPAWKQPAFLGDSFGTNLLRRAFVARQGIGQLSTHEAAYQRCETDADGKPLSGARRYSLRFAPGQLPPVDAFWSITLYSSKDYFLVPNAIERYAIGDRTPGLVRDADGGLTLTVQHAPPLDAGARANWLPAPEEAFFLCLRAYLPQVALIDGSYQLPEPQVRD
jgi:hypothetical protein